MNASAGVGPDVQQLARTILAMLDPLLQAAVTAMSAVDDGAPGACSQAWCPVCAVAAMASGEQHPMATVVAQHGVALLALIRALAERDEPSSSGSGTPAEPDGTAPRTPGRYQPIPVTVHE